MSVSGVLNPLARRPSTSASTVQRRQSSVGGAPVSPGYISANGSQPHAPRDADHGALVALPQGADASEAERIQWGSWRHFEIPWGTGSGTFECCFCRCKQRVPLYNYGVYCLKCGHLPLEWIPVEDTPMLSLKMMNQQTGLSNTGVNVVVQCPQCQRAISGAELKSHSLMCKADADARPKWTKIKPRLGLDTVTDEAQGSAITGALVVRVKAKGMPPSPQPHFEVGDLIISWDSRPVRSKEDLEAALNGCQPGDSVTIELLRNDKRLAMKVRIGAQISEADWQLLQSVIHGTERDPKQLERCLQIVVNDKQHWVWGVSECPQAVSAVRSPTPPLHSLGQHPMCDDSNLPPEFPPEPIPIHGHLRQEANVSSVHRPLSARPRSRAAPVLMSAADMAHGQIIQEAHSKLSTLKPRLGFLVGTGSTTGTVCVTKVFPEGMPDDVNQQVQATDVIVSWDRMPISSLRQFEDILLSMTVGQVTKMQILRDSSLFELTIKVGAQIAEADAQVLLRVTGGKPLPNDLARVPGIRVNDECHVVWHMEIKGLAQMEVDEAAALANDLLLNLEPKVGFTVVSTEWLNTLTGSTVPACQVSAAQKSDEDCLQEGDILFKWNGLPLPSSNVFSKLKAQVHPGDEVQINFIRGIRRGIATIKVGCQLSEKDFHWVMDVAQKKCENPGRLERLKELSETDDQGLVWGIQVAWEDPSMTQSSEMEDTSRDALQRRRQRFSESPDERPVAIIAAEKLTLLKPRTGLHLDQTPFQTMVGDIQYLGVVVVWVEPEGKPSEFDEQICVGDIIYKWQDTLVDAPAKFVELMLSSKPGEHVTLHLLRNEIVGTAELKIGAQISEEEAAILQRVAEGGTDPHDMAEARAVVVHDDNAVIWGLSASFPTFAKTAEGKALVHDAPENFDADDASTPATPTMPFITDAATVQMANEKLQKLKPRLGIGVTQTTCTPPGSHEAQPAVQVTLIRAKGLPEESDGRIQISDIILSWDGSAVETSHEFRRRLTRQRPGDVVHWKVLRGSTLLTFEICVGAQVPEDDAQMLQRIIQGKGDARDVRRCQELEVYNKKHFIWGMKAWEGPDYQLMAQDKLARLAPRLGVEINEVTVSNPEGGEAVGFMVVMVHPTLMTSTPPLQPGDMLQTWNGQPLSSEHVYWAQFHQLRPGGIVNLNVKRGEEVVQVSLRAGAQVSQTDAKLLSQVASGQLRGAEAAQVASIDMCESRHVAWFSTAGDNGEDVPALPSNSNWD